MTPTNIQATLTRMLLTGVCIPEDVDEFRAHIAALEADNAACVAHIREHRRDFDRTPRGLEMDAFLSLPHPGAHLLAEHATLTQDLEDCRASCEKNGAAYFAACEREKIALAEHAKMRDAWSRLCAVATSQGRSVGGVLDDAEGHRKALVRARNEGLEKAAAWHDAKGDAERTWLDMNEGRPNRPTTEAHRSFLECHRSSAIAIRAMTEPES